MIRLKILINIRKHYNLNHNMNRFFLKIARCVIPHMPRGKSLAIRTALALFGYKFGDVITLPDGRKFYISIISPVKKHLFFANKYEERDTQIFEKTVSLGDYFFDIGSSFGWYSTLASRLVGKSGKVFAFDMVPDIIKEFERNLALNKLDNNIVMVNKAWGDTDGVVDYLYSENTEMGNFKPEMLKDGHKEVRMETLRKGKVQMISLDKYVEEHSIPRVDFIKVDIDGAEVPFLRGARKTLVSKKPIVLIEVSERGQKAQGHSCLEIFQELSMAGYEFFSVRFMLRQIEPCEFGKVTKEDVLCLPTDKLILLPQLAQDLSRDELPRGEL